MKKKTKVMQGWYCTRCNHKIPDSQCESAHARISGVCKTCANKVHYNNIQNGQYIMLAILPELQHIRCVWGDKK